MPTFNAGARAAKSFHSVGVAMAMGRAITAADLIITAAGHIMAADIIGLTRVSGPRLLIALDPGLGAIRGAGTSSKLRSHANGASIVTINFPQLVLWTIILIILVIALL